MQTRWGTIFALWFAGLCAAGQFAKVAVVFESLSGRWPGAGVWLGLLVSIVGAVGIVFGTTAGIAVARLGARRLLIAALIAGACLSALQALGLPFWLMLATRVMEGFAHLAIVVAGPVLIAGSATPKDQPAAMTLWSTFFALAFAITAAVGIPLAQAHGDESLWAVHSGLMVIAAVLLARVLPREAPLPGEPLRFGAVLTDHVAIYASPRIAAPALGFVFYTMIYVAVLTLLPGLVEPRYHAITAAVMPLLSIVSSLGIGVQVTRRLGAVRTAQVGYAMGAVIALLWLFSSGVVEVAMAFLLSAALGFAQGAGFAAIPELNATAEDRARAAGAVAQLGNVGTTLGTPILLMLTTAYGAPAITWFVLPMCLGGIAMHAWLAARRRRA